MKIDNTDAANKLKENEELYKRLNKSIERKIVSKEDEVKKLDQHYEKKIATTKINGEDDYLLALERNEARIKDEADVVEDKLKNYNEQLNKTKYSVEKEVNNLKSGEKQNIADLKLQFEENFQEQFNNASENQREMQTRTQNLNRDITTKSNLERSQLENKTQFALSALTSDFNQKSSNTELKYKDDLERNLKQHTSNLNAQKEELNRVAKNDLDKNTRLSNEKLRVNQEQMNYQDKHQQSLLVQKDQDFKVRYEKIVKEHDDIIQNLSSRFKKDVQSLVDKTAKDKSLINEKLSDPFYQVDKLQPKITEAVDHYVVTLPVTEYEKDNVQLSTQGRGIKLTLSRRYKDSTLDEKTGVTDRSTRSELFSKELKVKDILDSKQITQSFENGELHFKILKA
jgi:HSP20 family molecular chaperone IbpA